MITFPHANVLFEGLGGSASGLTKRWVEGLGHVIPQEMRTEFNGWVEEIIAKGEQKNAEEGV
jgi:hypothetical protein